MATDGRSKAVQESLLCVKCQVVKFAETLNLTDTKAVNCSIHGLFSVQKRDGSTSLFRLKQGNTVHLSTETRRWKWERIFWDSRPPPSDRDGLFFTQDSDGTVIEFSVQGDSVTLKRQLQFAPLQSAIQSYSQCQISTVKLVGYESGYLLFLVNTDTLCTAEISGNVCLPCSWIPLPSSEAAMESDGSSHFQIAADVVAVLHMQAQLLFIYNLNNGKLVCQVDLEPAGFSTHTSAGEGNEAATHRLPWTTSLSLDKLVWLDRQGTIFSLDLERYVRCKPHTVKLPEDFQGSRARVGVSQTVQTCRRGGFSWRQALVDLHQQEMGHPADSAWSQHKLASSVSHKKQGSKSKVFACGFRRKQKSRSGRGVLDNFLKQFSLPSGNLLEVGYVVSRVQCSKSVLTMVLESSVDEEQQAVCMVDMNSSQLYVHSLPKHHFPVVTTPLCLPMLCLSPAGLLVLVPTSCADQEDVVTKMMVHSGAQCTDSLCQLNSWGRTTVPLHALELGLRQHQLDTVTFFLTSKENLFTGGSSKQNPSVYPTSSWADNAHISAMEELAPALDLFLKVINNGLPDMSPSREFCLRLLAQTLEFLHNLLKDGSVQSSQLGGTDLEVEEKKDLDRALEVVMSYIAQLRDAMVADELQQKRLMRALTMRSKSSASAEQGSVDSLSVDSVDAPSPAPVVLSEETIETACRDNDMPSLQAQLLSLGHDVTAQWAEVVKIGLLRAWSHVQHKDISAAQTIISNLGLDVADTVWKLAQFTTDRNLQYYIIQQLSAAATLSAEDLVLVDNLKKVYTAYPSSSVKHTLLKRGGGMTWSAENPVASHLRSVETTVASEAKDVKSSVSNNTSQDTADGPYCAVTLHWLRQMHPEMIEAILLDGAALREGSFDESGFTPRHRWRFWLSRNQPQRAIQALDAAIVAERGMMGRLLGDYLQDLHRSAGFVQHDVKRHLMGKKSNRSETLHSLDVSVEEQVWLLKGLLHTPHPLVDSGHHTLWEFHHQFAAYCANYGFVVPLWKYCSMHGVDVESLLEGEFARDIGWFKPFVYLHSAINQPGGSSRMFASSLSMASIHWKADDWSLAQLLKEGHVTTAVATLAYLPETESVTQNTNGETVFSVDAELLRSGLQRFPKLLSALLPPDADTSRFDINVYELLRDNAPLNTRRLFGWQSTNATASEDGMKALPYFSHPDLVARFAHTAKLNFTFYLKHGRPSYAFLSFLAEELQHKTSTLSLKRVQAACGIALWLCVKHFHNCQVSAACVAFVEMLGRDSIVLRTYVHAGETMLAHRVRNLHTSVDKRKEQQRAGEQEVASLLQSCLSHRHRHGRRLVAKVEDAIADEIAREGLSSTSVEAALKWNLAILICHHLHLPLTTRFLESCARDDRWLPFVWFAQLHQYPKTQLQKILHQFPSRHLRDHLHYIITNASNNTVTSSTVSPDAGEGGGGSGADGSRNVRSSLYSKIGVQTSVEQGEVSSDDEEAAQQEKTDRRRSTSRQTSEDDIEVTEESSASDVFRVIFSAMATSEPWKSLLMHAVVLRNPLFAELAGCCNAPMVSCISAWLVAMLVVTEHTHFLQHHGKRAWKWSVGQLEKLIEVYLQCHAENTLTAAFFIFQPTSPLLPFLQFIAQCVSWRNYEGCKQHLDNFKDSMAASSPVSDRGGGRGQRHRERVKAEQSAESGDPADKVIGDRDWLERVAYNIVRHELVHCPSVHDAVHILSLLAEENIALVFSFDVLDFGHLHKMLAILHKHQVTDVHLPHLFSDSPERHDYLQECQKALKSLMTQGVYEDAYTFGQFAGLDLSAVVLRHLATEKLQLQTSGVWRSAVVRRRYWKRCGARCARFRLPPATAVHFFQKEADDRESSKEKSELFKLSLAHLKSHSDQLRADRFSALRDHVFTCMWRFRLQDRVSRQTKAEQEEEAEDIFSDSEDTETSTKTTTDREQLLHSAALPKPQVDPAGELTSEEAMELERVMGELLSEGRVSECCDLARLLGGQSSDLTIVLTCIGLSTGEVTVDTMDAASKLMLTTTERRLSLTSLSSFARTISSVSLASAAPNWGCLPSAQEETIFTLEQLLSRCRKARPFCMRIISVYKIACLTSHSYRDIVMAEEFLVLRELLKTDFPQRYILAAEFLSTSTLSDEEVASFLVDEIVKSLHIYLGGKDGFDAGRSHSSGTSELIFRPTEGGEVFSQLVSMCADPAILGDKLLHALATMADDAPEPTHSVLSMETELLIMAHECHTAACNMEGISNVLRAARVCAQCLSTANQYQLMMRLLTGIGRYSEMTYIFDYLQQHHQFEMLLRKGIDKEDKLKTAILDYLKRFHSDDKDTYSMVALNFSMYREIAHMLDESGHRYLAQLKDKSLDSNKETQDTLKKCIQYFGDAAESYAKDKCYTNAQKCLRWARLVNLQIQLLGSGVRVINLTSEEVKMFAETHPKFLEAYVVTEAYGKVMDWSESLYSHVLLSADMRYLQDFRTYVKLTPSLIESTLYKLRNSPGKLTSSLAQVKKLLKLCPNVWLQYKIAQDLGLQEVIKELLRSDSTCSYIQDLINSQ